MSWKATAYVKEITEGLNVTSKFVLLMLAEYHRTDGRNEWPGTARLAGECLITERALRAVLSRLAVDDFIRRKIGGGRGNVTTFLIGGVDYEKGILNQGLEKQGLEKQGNKPCTQEPKTLHVGSENPDRNDTRNKVLPVNTKHKPNGYVRPTLEEVIAYCVERGNQVDADQWFDYYSANGWRVGRNAMKDWKAAVRTWERQERENGYGTQQPVSRAAQRSDRIKQNILNGFAANARRRDTPDGTERQD